MPTIAIIGAGPGLGLSIAKIFGSHRFAVALISRSRAKLDPLVAELSGLGIAAAAFPADVTDRAALVAALGAAVARFGPIDVLEYSPYGGLTTVDPLDATVDNLQPQIEHHLYGAVAATRAVLPTMLESGAGTLLFTTGGGAITPYPMLSTVNAAQAALRNWALNLNGVLASKGVHAANVAINVLIGASAPAGVPHRAPDEIARIYWDLHIDRRQAEYLVTA